MTILGFMLLASVLFIAAALLPNPWLAYFPRPIVRVAHLRRPLAVVGGAIPLGIGMGYLIVLLQSL